MSIDALADSGFLFSLYDLSEPNHDRVLQAAEQIRGSLIILNVTLTEVAFLFRRAGGYYAMAQFLTLLTATDPDLQSLTSRDLVRARDIMNAYPRADLDFVDCCIASVAERLNITQIATLDRRDFSIIRPRHCDYFELIP